MMRALGWLSRLARGMPPSVVKPPADEARPSRMPAPSTLTAGEHTTFGLNAAANMAAAQHETGEEAAADQAPSFGARRPLLAVSGEVAGFEFRLAETVEQRLSKKDNAVVRSAHQIALLSSMRSTLATGRLGLASMPASLLERSAVVAQVPDGAMLVVPDLDPSSMPQREALETLRQRNVRIGVPIPSGSDGDLPATAALADFAVLTLDERGIDGLMVQAAAWHAAHPDRPILATELPDIDAIEKVLKPPIAYATGRVDAQGPTREIKPLKAGAQRICKMLNDVVMDRDTTQIAADVRADVALSYRMLRYVNSPALGLSRRVESVEQAMAVLGRNELYRWLSVLLLAAGEGRRASRALQEIALARARLLELMAREGEDPPDALFTVGLLSLLDAMLQVPLDKAIAPLNLGESARQALLEHSGPWADYLGVASALEQHDTGTLETLAARFGGGERVMELSEQAWRWANELTQAQREAG